MLIGNNPSHHFYDEKVSKCKLLSYIATIYCSVVTCVNCSGYKCSDLAHYKGMLMHTDRVILM